MNEQPPQRPSLRRVIQSALAAAIGVQSQKNRERDFGHGSAARYVVAGVIGTTLFVLTIYVVVRLVLRAAGA